MQKPKKLYILDTNVLIADPESVFKFEEHDIFLPHTVLEELDGLKKGHENVARSARAANRTIESVISSEGSEAEEPCIYSHCYSLGKEQGLGSIIFEPITRDTLSSKKSSYGDNSILLSVIAISEALEADTDEFPYESITLVSKDINMRIKAKNLGIAVEDYLNDHVISDSDLLPTGVHYFDEEHLPCLESHYGKGGQHISFEPNDKSFLKNIYPNEFINRNDKYYKVLTNDLNVLQCVEIKNYFVKENIWGINARNDEQNLAMNLLLDPEIHLISLLGPAGTGKTLITLAAALNSILDKGVYDDAIITRATVESSHEIGFLPGTEEEKMTPWMGAFFDNLEVLGLDSTDQNNEQVTKKIHMKSITFMRGRSFRRKFIIIDEAQNLTQKELKLLLTRSGEGSKVVLMGNLSQIDSAYVNEVSSGLAYAVEKLKDWKRSGHLLLSESVRSELAEIAEKRL